MADLTFTYSLVDHGSHIALHEVAFRGRDAVAMKAAPVTFTAPSSAQRHDLAAEMALAYACANDMPIVPAVGLLVVT